MFHRTALLLLVLLFPCTVMGEESLGAALSTIFSPRSAPTARTMGLVQRTFLDLVEESRRELEIAFVIDGTESMGEQLAAAASTLSTMMGDLELYRENNISYQVVVYRDVGAPSGEVALPLGDGGAFTADRDAVLRAVESIGPESGAPYFPELVDEGLSVALNRLQWSEGDGVSRWVFLIGDAPPFDASFEEPENQAGRRVSTDKLVALAEAKGVSISCVLCESRTEDRETSERLLSKTRDFMNTLSSKTGGLMLDLTYDDIRGAIAAAPPAPPVEHVRVRPISYDDIRQTMAVAEQRSSALSQDRRVRLAVLPHLSLSEMSFEPDNRGVQVATELRMRLQELPRVEMVLPARLEQQFTLQQRRGLRGESLLQTLGARLGADYVVWGRLGGSGGVLRVESGLYDPRDGRLATSVRVATNPTTPPEKLVNALTQQLLASAATSQATSRLAASFAELKEYADPDEQPFRTVSNAEALGPLMAGVESLERSLAYPVGDLEGSELVDLARTRLAEAAKLDPSNPLVHFSLAGCLLSRSNQLEHAGDPEAAAKEASRYANALRRAHRFADRMTDPTLRAEIEADYLLLIERDAARALKLYQELAENQGGAELRSALHANWMLAGIYAGDWGVDQALVDADLARDHLVKILAFWPDSHEAQFIKRRMRWDEQNRETRFQNFPRENADVAEAAAASQETL